MENNVLTKRRKITLRLCTLLLTFLLISSLLGCSAQGGHPSETDRGGETDSSSPSESGHASITEPANDNGADASKELLTYYVSLVEDLQEEILALKAENFMLTTALNDRETADTDASVTPTLPFTYEEDDGTVTILSYIGKEKSVTVPAEINGLPVTEIGESAFADSSVTSVVLPDTVTEIEWFAFSGCYALKSVTAGASVTEIGYGAFDGCSSALTLICPKGSYLEKYARSFGIAVRNP